MTELKNTERKKAKCKSLDKALVIPGPGEIPEEERNNIIKEAFGRLCSDEQPTPSTKHCMTDEHLNAVVHFLHSDKQAKIIKEMYGDTFDSISPNRKKYLTFLQQVEDDGRIKELNDILKRYGK